MSHELDGYRSDSDQGLCLDDTLRAGSQYIEMLDITVPSSSGGQYITTSRNHDHWRCSSDVDTCCHDRHCI
jgi:hypothetical protein